MIYSQTCVNGHLWTAANLDSAQLKLELKCPLNNDHQSTTAIQNPPLINNQVLVHNGHSLELWGFSFFNSELEMLEYLIEQH